MLRSPSTPPRRALISQETSICCPCIKSLQNTASTCIQTAWNMARDARDWIFEGEEPLLINQAQISNLMDNFLQHDAAFEPLKTLFEKHYNDANYDLLLGSYHDIESDIHRFATQPEKFSKLVSLYAYGSLTQNQDIQESCSQFLLNQRFFWVREAINKYPRCFNLIQQHYERAQTNYQSGQFLHPSQIQVQLPSSSFQDRFEKQVASLLSQNALVVDDRYQITYA